MQERNDRTRRERGLSGDPRDDASSPRVWLVLGEKRGDNAQVENLAEAVGWPVERKWMVVRPEWTVTKPRVRPTLDHIDRDGSDPLEPPWPDIVITAGRRLSSVGLWIKRASGDRTKLVMIGKPRRLLGRVDLVVVAAHYVLPEAPNVARHDLPMMHADPKTLERAAAAWRTRLADMPRPLTALFVGGPTGGLRLDAAEVRDVLSKTLADVRASDGSLYVSTSRRTPAAVVDLLRRELPDGARLFAFDPAASVSDNPYHALLVLADHFVVTSDSISMMVEVARLGRPLSIHPLGIEVGLVEGWLERRGVVRPLSPRHDPLPAGGLRARTMFRLGWPRHSRDLSAIPRRLVERGLASWLGEPRRAPAPYVDDELEAIAARIRALVATDGSASDPRGAAPTSAPGPSRVYEVGVTGSGRRL